MGSARRRMMMQVLGGGKEYIEFADPAVEQICATKWGDGVGLTYAQAAAVTSISNSVFSNNTSIASFDELQYFTGVTSWGGTTGSNGKGVFTGCSGLVSVTLPPNQTFLGNNAFRNCSNLETVDNADNVTTISEYCFHSCSKLSSIDLSSVTSIGLQAFRGSAGFELDAPNLSSIGQMAFYQSKLTKIVSLGSITSIPRDSNGSNGGCFNKCTSLTEAVLPSTLTSIGKYAFGGCTNLTTINLPSAIETLDDYVFKGDSKLEIEVNFPNLTSIGREVFYGTKITKAVFGKIVTLTGSSYGIFYNCKSLTYVDLPDTVTSIGQAAFRGCTSLTTLICRATAPPSLGSNALQNSPSSQKIYVPYGYGSTYRGTSGWSSYSSRINELNPDGTIPS